MNSVGSSLVARGVSKFLPFSTRFGSVTSHLISILQGFDLLKLTLPSRCICQGQLGGPIKFLADEQGEYTSHLARMLVPPMVDNGSPGFWHGQQA